MNNLVEIQKRVEDLSVYYGKDSLYYMKNSVVYVRFDVEYGKFYFDPEYWNDLNIILVGDYLLELLHLSSDRRYFCTWASHLRIITWKNYFVNVV